MLELLIYSTCLSQSGMYVHTLTINIFFQGISMQTSPGTPAVGVQGLVSHRHTSLGDPAGVTGAEEEGPSGPITLLTPTTPCTSQTRWDRGEGPARTDREAGEEVGTHSRILLITGIYMKDAYYNKKKIHSDLLEECKH